MSLALNPMPFGFQNTYQAIVHAHVVTIIMHINGNTVLIIILPRYLLWLVNTQYLHCYAHTYRTSIRFNF